MKFTVALTEDNVINKNTFLQKITQLTNYHVLFTAESGYACLKELKGLPDSKLPQVIFMDLEMPGMTGIETIAIAKSTFPQIHFIVLTVFDDDDKIFDAIRAGASGYLLKHEPAAFINEAVVNVLEHGGAPMSPAIARKALQLLINSSKTDAAPANKIFPSIITQREKEILEYTVNGWDAKRISSKLNISTLTVRKHIANIYQKLQVRSKAQIIQMAHKNRWFKEDRES
ncbi:MAG: response regulator transcription factor [Bacteroidota bacterium]|nr:response regulator transcription factor [Bacteroidota bacterium]MDQ6890058.1 response regulator transcription factor [Bacteroidota bacterium]